MSKDGDDRAEVVGVRRERHDGLHRDVRVAHLLARAGDRRHPRLVVGGLGEAVVGEAGVVSDGEAE